MQAAIDKILKCKSAAVMAHINEDPDALGSGFAMTAMLRKMGKDAVFYLSDEIETSLKFIGGPYTVYNGENDISKHDLCICLDCGELKRLGDRAEVLDKINNSVNIDHHYTNTGFGDANYIDAKAAATAQILYELFDMMNWKLDDEIARYLYIAIASDSGCFKYSNTSPKTMRIAADLLEYNINHDEALRLLFDTCTLDVMKMKAEVMSNIHTYCNGKISLISIDEELYQKFNLTDKDVSDFVNIPKCIKGTEIAVCMKRKGDKIRLNFRSNGGVNVAEVAKTFGGGGHIRAAGGTVTDMTMADAEAVVVKECEKAIEKI